MKIYTIVFKNGYRLRLDAAEYANILAFAKSDPNGFYVNEKEEIAVRMHDVAMMAAQNVKEEADEKE